MSCPTGYMERNGGCEYGGYLPGDANLDGTPNTTGDQGGNFWSQVGDALNKYGPLILIGAGSFWQSKQGDNTQQQPTGNATKPPAPAAQKTGLPMWAWVAIGAAVLLIVVLLVRGRK